MAPISIERNYFDWLCHLVYDDRFRSRYDKLLELMYEVDFTWILPMDENRAIDGAELRNAYGIVDVRPCSLLEALVGLCVRVENSIAQDEELGDRTSEWFWTMINTMKLSGQNDEQFDRDYCLNRFSILMNRQFSPNGEGGLFILDHPRQDLRYVDFWYHFMWYLSEQGGY